MVFTPCARPVNVLYCVMKIVILTHRWSKFIDSRIETEWPWTITCTKRVVWKILFAVPMLVCTSSLAAKSCCLQLWSPVCVLLFVLPAGCSAWLPAEPSSVPSPDDVSLSMPRGTAAAGLLPPPPAPLPNLYPLHSILPALQIPNKQKGNISLVRRRDSSGRTRYCHWNLG